jgi:hypothetical protein
VCALKNATFAHISTASCWANYLDNAPTLGLYPNLEGGNFCEIASVCSKCICGLNAFSRFVFFNSSCTPLHLSTQKEEEEEEEDHQHQQNYV